MKISLNWLKSYIDLNDDYQKIGEKLTDTGLEVEGIEVTEPVKGGLKGLVIGEVKTCEKHPNADKLKITTVDIGEDEFSPIVCGAPNVAAGQKVIVATVGTTLYPSGSEPFKIKKAKIRGEVSKGMICAEDEIGIGTDHSGIIVLDTDMANGTPASDFYQFEEDVVFEIGLTPNRADAASHIGTARDLKAVYNTPVKWPDVSAFNVQSNNLPIKVEVKNTEACPRYSGVSISNVQISESPDWLKNRLLSIGLTPINNVVDATNFVLHELGQPLHAFDADQIKNNTVIVDTLKEGSVFTTLDEKERKLGANDLMICNGEREGMCIAGVFGGIKSGVTESTTKVFLESAYFSPEYIRKTAQKHQLKTDASFRYERGTDPDITVYALKRAALLICELTGGQISSEIVDEYPEVLKPFEVPVKYKNIDRLIGKKLDRSLIGKILTSLDIELSNTSEDGFTAIVPQYRVDVQREADVIEEILRIYGFNNIELPSSFSSDYLADFPAVDRDKEAQALNNLLTSNGFYEVITNSLTNPEYAEKSPKLNEDNHVVILNKLSEELGVMRQTLLFSILEVARYNISHRQNDLKLFELGKHYFHKKGKYIEEGRLALAVTGNSHPESWESGTQKANFFDLQNSCRLIMEKFGLQHYEAEPLHEYPFEYGVAWTVNGKVIGELGAVQKAVRKEFEIKQDIFYANFNWDLLLSLTNNNIVYQEVSKFPEVRRDLSLVIDTSVTYEQIKKLAWKTEKKLVKRMNVFDVYQGDKIESTKKAYALSFILQDNERTLTDKIIDKTMQRLISAFENELGAVIRK